MIRYLASFLEYLLMLMVILEFNTPYTYFPVIRHGVFLSIIGLLGILCLLSWRHVSFEILAFAFAILIGALFPFLNVYENGFKNYVRLYVIIFPLLVVLLASYLNRSEDECQHLLLKFSNLVVALAVISLFFWIFGSTLGVIPSTAIIPNSWGHAKFIPTYYGIYFETQEAVASAGAESMIRNSGIFNEAPMHNMILCTALAVELCIRQTKSIKRIILLIFTIITTISTTGFIFMFLLLSIKSYQAFASRYKLQMLLLIPLLFMVALFFVGEILDNKKETGEGSYNSRGADVVKCIEVGFEHPISGVGVFFKSEENSSESRSFGYSNSLFGTFAHGGLYLVSLYIIALLVMPVLIYWRTGNLSFMLFMLSYFLLFTFTVSQYKVLTLFMVSYCLSYWYELTFSQHSVSGNMLYGKVD